MGKVCGAVQTIGKKGTAETVFGGIKSFLGDTWDGIKSAAGTAWEGIKSAISGAMEKATSTVSGALEKIKGFFSGCKLEFPKIKLPHFSLEGKVGVRRSGKSTMLYKRVLDLVASGVEWSQICYINFEDDRLIEFSNKDFDDVIESAHEFTEMTRNLSSFSISLATTRTTI